MIKKIYFFWYQGIHEAPLLVHKCLDSWKFYNSNWEIIILDSQNYNMYCNFSNTTLKEFEKYKLISINHFSDILRLAILKINGGLWVDATCFCNDPLDKWLIFFDPPELFIFRNLTSLGNMISSWFIYSGKNNYTITKWYEEIINIYENKLEEFAQKYFIQYDIFDNLYKKDIIFKMNWDKIKDIYNQNDHMMYFDLYKKGNLYIENNGFLEPITEEIKKIIINKEKFLFKLSYKCDFDNKYNNDTILAFLFDSIK